jgi:plasmid stability protein
MAEIVLREVDDAVTQRLAKLASDNGRSLEDQAKHLLTEAVGRRSPVREDRRAMAARIAAMTPKGVTQTDSTGLIREDRDR